ncbi:MAG: dihydrolipoyl dehydrogenase [Chloroflexota bacterium]
MTSAKSLIIIGGGVAGYVAAIRAAQLGGQVTLVEKDALGGTCLNRGCIPTKALLQSAAVLWQTKRAADFGVKVSPPTLDFGTVARRKDAIVQQLVAGVTTLMKKNKVRVIKGSGTIVAPGRVKVDSGEEISGDAILVATGSRPATVPIPGVDQPGVITSDQALALTELPASVVIIGGGVIGLEFAQLWHRLGVKVTVVEMMPQVLPNEDSEVAKMLEALLTDEGIAIFTGARVNAIKTASSGQVVAFTSQDEAREVTAERVMVAVGRRPNSDNLGLEALGVSLEKGNIVVDEYLATGVAGVYAAGDVLGGIMLAHKAMADGRVAAQNALGSPTEADYRAVPRCVYTSPEVAAVGLTESQAKAKYPRVQVGRFPFKANGKALILGESEGMVKVIADAEYGELLGVAILGPHATDLIAEATLGISLEATFKDLAGAIHAHPTLAEAVMEAALAVEGGAVHL